MRDRSAAGATSTDAAYENACADVIRRLRIWADARDRRNPNGHGKTGTALLRDAADLLSRAERRDA